MKELNDMKERESKAKKRIWEGIYSDKVLRKLRVEKSCVLSSGSQGTGKAEMADSS